MSQRGWIYLVLEVPLVYDLVQKVFNGKQAMRVWASLVSEKKAGRVLDLGCGPGTNTAMFQGSESYLGIDLSESYVSEAKKLHARVGDFRVMSAGDIDQLPENGFDLILARYLFHHLEDAEVADVLRKAFKKLKKGGQLVSMDPTYVRGRFLANLVARMDRGKNVRPASELADICGRYFDSVDCNVHEQFFLPANRVFLKMTK